MVFLQAHNHDQDVGIWGIQSLFRKIYIHIYYGIDFGQGIAVIQPIYTENLRTTIQI